MRDFFIVWMERIVNVVVILGAIGVLIGAIAAMFSPQGGILQGLAVLIGGTIYMILLGGMIYLGLGIYNNTRRTAEAIERLADRP
ncbi:hypothetical protein J7376_03135 [Paracoccus sp. R12_1]|jgi:hypothetical protein|uniref:hypothetical protein n=1 Tax=unclassified Paracoccus (in: a-proteobacteria) TaxID=2688777 RepID=UPI001ADBD4D1|nr:MULTISPECIES: hypothetical protein [unclassified Paracoccus (in: a-proteobacteria)]MBO9454809.1 hypothetical protein [Paracoccus sp. R12_2]MBO9485503.1 hypothetical protein [Paracoccus sp. R12_1]